MFITVQSMQIHPVANIFPPMGAREFQALCDDVRAHGLREPIWLHEDGRIIDGRHRYRACGVVGIEPQFRTWDGSGEVVSFVVSLNLHRRHLDESQRALVAARIATLAQGQRADRSIDLSSVTQQDAADMLNVSVPSVKRAREVLDTGAPQLVEAVERGDLSVSFAAQVAELPEKDQQDIAILPKQEAIEEYKRRAHVAHNSGNNEWYTPPQFIAAARDAMGGIDVDPASSLIANQTVGAKEYFTAEDDGLTREWRGNVWMNPPYAQPLINQFAEAVSDRFDTKQIKRACVLVNNATETGWFQRMLASASAVCFLRTRVKFLDPEGNPSGAPLQGQTVIYMGDNPYRFARSFRDLGCVLVQMEPVE